ncbi:arginase family protein [Maridesulfovibrio hydrothermalis]|uniref:Arginase/agmatinase/formiminoglutamase n=1 Tax=Maridesulfovibrio hydrothermalis AM13 = DSM 14728 TaxID=1121451 RepID=L0R8K9_9BACT|nr:arginase family protein [Maridesulfovibrio hydrothermalis]CCO22562.1 Arginase/agmatinase/formiminoglutamase [Maridesulfovibrio hydrothermalis AM13 = DSM 14728]
MKDLTLVFPQWQGAIDNMALFDGAVLLAENIPGLPAVSTVEIPPLKALKTCDSIAGKGDIVSQLGSACKTIKTENPDRILLLGGDCSTETGPVSWMNEKYSDRLALIWFDAHPDLNTPLTTKSGRMQGMALSAILGNGGMDITKTMFKPLMPRQVFCAGVREFDPPELDFITENKIPFFGPGELERDPAWLAKQICKAGFSKVYIHIDVDAINPMGFPHSKPSPPAGLPFGRTLKMIEEIKNRLDICGLGLTEFHPGNERGVEKVQELIITALDGFLLGEGLIATKDH